MVEWEWTEAFDCEVWRPILDWSEEDVIAIHKRHRLMPNPLYLMGARRVGCWPCINARKAEIKLIADTDPERIDRIRSLEADVSAAQRARAAAKGEPPPPNDAGWFQSPLGRTGECWPIDEVAMWSRTARGGQQFELFAPDPSEEGCMRWGLCETHETA
jgi:3'-phosphoadenosine 5'-phosphosulfate sulfotransferase (PAPS reductase)/FAD synthetase